VAPPLRYGNRIVFDRGVVREIYDVAVDRVEQTFVLDAGAGDVELDVEVRSELCEDSARAGLQFGNELGLVHYGTAFLVDGQSKREIATAWAANTLTLRDASAQRGHGAVVIDPIIHTSAFSHATTRDCHNPDIAYDATTDRYLVCVGTLLLADRHRRVQRVPQRRRHRGGRHSRQHRLHHADARASARRQPQQQQPVPRRDATAGGGRLADLGPPAPG
jgi:hypothetical protein